MKLPSFSSGTAGIVLAASLGLTACNAAPPEDETESDSNFIERNGVAESPDSGLADSNEPLPIITLQGKVEEEVEAELAPLPDPTITSPETICDELDTLSLVHAYDHFWYWHGNDDSDEPGIEELPMVYQQTFIAGEQTDDCCDSTGIECRYVFSSDTTREFGGLTILNEAPTYEGDYAVFGDDIPPWGTLDKHAWGYANLYPSRSSYSSWLYDGYSGNIKMPDAQLEYQRLLESIQTKIENGEIQPVDPDSHLREVLEYE